MAPAYGTKVSHRRAHRKAFKLPASLQPDEEPRLVVRARRLSPVIDLVVVTDARVLGFCVKPNGPSSVEPGRKVRRAGR